MAWSGDGPELGARGSLAVVRAQGDPGKEKKAHHAERDGYDEGRDKRPCFAWCPGFTVVPFAALCTATTGRGFVHRDMTTAPRRCPSRFC